STLCTDQCKHPHSPHQDPAQEETHLSLPHNLSHPDIHFQNLPACNRTPPADAGTEKILRFPLPPAVPQCRSRSQDKSAGVLSFYPASTLPARKYPIRNPAAEHVCPAE